MKQMRLFVISLLLVLTLAVPALAETADAAAATTPEEALQQWYALSALLHDYGNYPYVELRKGDTGYEVTALQTRLAELGYYEKKIVDNFGSGIYSALRAFEKANGLTVDGKASVADQQLLFSSEAKVYTQQKNTSTGNGGSTHSTSNSGADATSGATN